ncbi:three-Cys-motif partner protein TcmP [Desulfobacula toluolica]|uniref:Conserved uncharacterized protein n=1 Tax=Desulfobacula toluolica (strain DSM 7467 / Tol2) TaxID=651182 RepID=K0NQR5_DESTT|nr:three-Cys-motif partner protein TcmP [Desulfobacula toluolica]CCK81267.1 conserved uncharacterized protein [Desulfobacula toluolica Tol2]
MPIKDLHDEKPFDSATITKLEIFENYLTEWLPTFIYSKNNNELNICDFFAGPGEDIMGMPGSPLRILEVLKKFETDIKQQKIKINLILNEQKKWKHDVLIKNIMDKTTSFNNEFQKRIKIHFFKEDFQNLFPRIKNNIINGPNLLFFDQNGVKHITLNLINELESFHQTDYLFFISSAFFKRFTFENIFPDLKFNKDDVKSKDIHRTIVEQFRTLLPQDSKTRLYHFSIKKNKNIHGLVFGSKHLLAVQKFLTVAWNKNKINGEANFDIDEDLDKQLDLFSRKPKITKLQKFEHNLNLFIKEKKVFTNQDIFHYTLEKGFTPKHATAVLKKLKNSNHIEHFSYAKIGYNQIYKYNEIITFRYIK